MCSAFMSAERSIFESFSNFFNKDCNQECVEQTIRTVWYFDFTHARFFFI
jgi:hypothetical protein